MASKQGECRSTGDRLRRDQLSKKTWVLGIAAPHRDRPSIHRITGGNLGELVGRLRAAAREDRRILICYEAGYDSFVSAQPPRSDSARMAESMNG
jgi:hypothetical protein